MRELRSGKCETGALVLLFFSFFLFIYALFAFILIVTVSEEGVRMKPGEQHLVPVSSSSSCASVTSSGKVRLSLPIRRSSGINSSQKYLVCITLMRLSV